MVSAGLMLGELALLNRLGQESGTWRQLFGVEFPAPPPREARVMSRKLPTAFVASCIALLVFITVSILIPRPVETYPARAGFNEFPMHLGPWDGHREGMEGVYLDALKLDDYLLADFSDGAGAPVNVYFAYYDSQRKGEAFHSPRWCLPGGGWQMRDFNQRIFNDIKVDGRPLHVNRSLMTLGNQQQIVYYWFQQRGRIVTNEYAVKWWLFWDALIRHRTDGGLVRLVVSLPAGTTEVAADRRLIDLASRIAATLTRYFPD